MIDVSQWRASIGLWNYCQAASSRPANGRHSHSFKAAVDSKSGSAATGEKTSKLPAALSLIVSLLLSLLRYMKFNFIQPTGIITVTVMIHCLQSLVLFIATIGSSSDLIYYLVLLLLLLLSGDVELNPGPTGMMNRVWNWIRTKIFRCLPSNEGSQHSIAISQNDAEHIHHLQMQESQDTASIAPTSTVAVPTDAPTTSTIPAVRTDAPTTSTIPVVPTDAPTTSTIPVVPTVSSSVSVINEPVTSATSGNPKDVLRSLSDKLVHAISVNLYNVTDALYAKELIPQQTKEEVHVLGVTNNEKSSKLVIAIEQELEGSLNPEQYLIDICHVLINQQHRTLSDIATSILHQLGQSIPDNVSSHTVLPSPVDDISNIPVTNIRGPENPSALNVSNGATLGNTQKWNKMDEKAFFREISSDLERATQIAKEADVNEDLHLLLLGRPGVGKSTFARELMGGIFKGSSGPMGGTKCRDIPGQRKYIKTEKIEEKISTKIDGSNKKVYFVHEIIGLGDVRVDLDEMKREAKEIFEHCIVFLCIGWEDRINSIDIQIAFDVCDSLGMWQNVVVVITKCNSIYQESDSTSAESIRMKAMECEWKESIAVKLESMNVEGSEIAKITENIVFYPNNKIKPADQESYLTWASTFITRLRDIVQSEKNVDNTAPMLSIGISVMLNLLSKTIDKLISIEEPMKEH